MTGHVGDLLFLEPFALDGVFFSPLQPRVPMGFLKDLHTRHFNDCSHLWLCMFLLLEFFPPKNGAFGW